MLKHAWYRIHKPGICSVCGEKAFHKLVLAHHNLVNDVEGPENWRRTLVRCDDHAWRATGKEGTCRHGQSFELDGEQIDDRKNATHA